MADGKHVTRDPASVQGASERLRPRFRAGSGGGPLPPVGTGRRPPPGWSLASGARSPPGNSRSRALYVRTAAEQARTTAWWSTGKLWLEVNESTQYIEDIALHPGYLRVAVPALTLRNYAA